MPKTKTKKKAPKARLKKKLPCDLDAAFLEEIKDAVVFLQRGPEPQTSIRSFVEDACRSKIQAVRKKHGAIPKRPRTRPRQGRPMS